MGVNEIVYTLAFIKNGDDVFLGRKTRGIGKGLWNGFGGKVESTETLQEAAKREIKEECGLDVSDLKHIGFMLYKEHDGVNVHIVHMFTAKQFRGNPKASDEMNPVQWYHRKDLESLEMHQDFKYWKKYMFEEKYFCGWLRFCTYNQKRVVMDKFTQECDSLEEVNEKLEAFRAMD